VFIKYIYFCVCVCVCVFEVGKGKGKVHSCTGTEAHYRPYGQ